MTVTLELWNKKIDLEVDFNLYDGDEVSSEQKDLLDSFVNSGIETLNDETSVKKYLLDNYDIEVEDILSVVTPRTIFIDGDELNTVALLCDLSVDIENGMAIVFRGDNIIEIGYQDIAL